MGCWFDLLLVVEFEVKKYAGPGPLTGVALPQLSSTYGKLSFGFQTSMPSSTGLKTIIIFHVEIYVNTHGNIWKWKCIDIIYMEIYHITAIT